MERPNENGGNGNSNLAPETFISMSDWCLEDISSQIYEFFDLYFFYILNNKQFNYYRILIIIIHCLILLSSIGILLDTIAIFHLVHWSLPSSSWLRFVVLLRNIYALIHYIFARSTALNFRTGMASYTRTAMFMLHVTIPSFVILVHMFFSSFDEIFQPFHKECKFNR